LRPILASLKSAARLYPGVGDWQRLVS